jgi:hypothetical protein
MCPVCFVTHVPGRTVELGRWKGAIWQEALKDFSSAFELPHISCNRIAQNSATRQEFENVFAVTQSNCKRKIWRDTHAC